MKATSFASSCSRRRKISKLAECLVLVLLLLTIGSRAVASDTVLQTGDTIRLSAEGVRAGAYEVDTAGFITLPGLGKVRAAGLTHSALQRSIAAAYRSISGGDSAASTLINARSKELEKAELESRRRAALEKLSEVEARIAGVQNRILELMSRKDLNDADYRDLETARFQLKELKDRREILTRLVSASD